jgi:hypothetical protein
MWKLCQTSVSKTLDFCWIDFCGALKNIGVENIGTELYSNLLKKKMKKSLDAVCINQISHLAWLSFFDVRILMGHPLYIQCDHMVEKIRDYFHCSKLIILSNQSKKLKIFRLPSNRVIQNSFQLSLFIKFCEDTLEKDLLLR